MNDEEHYTKVREAMNVILGSVNVMSSQSEDTVSNAMFEELIKTHRTLQASYIRCLIKTLTDYGRIQYDQRNEAAVM